MEHKPRSVPWPVFEEIMARNSQTVKRLTSIIILLIIFLFVACVGIGLVAAYYENQMETTVVWQDSADDGINNYVGNDGDITNNTVGGDD